MPTRTQSPSGRRLRAFATHGLAALATALAAHLASAPSVAAAIPASAACPDPGAAQVGTAQADVLRAGRVAGCLLGDEGDDRLKGGFDADVLDPGPGADRVRGGGGDDVIVVRSACEVSPGETLKGGSGNDTLRSPFTLAELEAMGVKVRAIEVVDVTPNVNEGACVETASGVACTCCERDGFDPARGCTGCEAGRILDNPAFGNGDLVGSRLPEASCVAAPDCDDLACGTRGHCVEREGSGATCACDLGWTGPSCDTCAPPWEPTTDGRCQLGRRCAREMCGGHGRCVADADGELSCDCDPGFEGRESCGGPDFVVGGPQHVVAGSAAVRFAVLEKNGGHCTGGFEWSVDGPGTVTPDAGDSRQASYTPPAAVVGHIDVARVEARCDNAPEFDDSFDVSITDGGVDGGVGGSCAKEMEPFDEQVLGWMEDNGIAGATLAVTFYENVLCLRGYGNREVNAAAASSPMKQCTPMRVASVTKPFARAALRGNLLGTTIPFALGGGTLGENTPVLPLVAPDVGVGPGGEISWEAPATLYSAGHPFNNNQIGILNPIDGIIANNWNLVTVSDVLGHTAGYPPNQNYAWSPTTGGCTGAADEVCGDMQNVGDPTITATTRMANDLGLAYGVPTTSDIVRWVHGTSPYDVRIAGRVRYSNVGFTVAGRVVANLTGQDWDDFVTAFLTNDDVIDLDAPGNPIVYLGQSKGGGPADFLLPDHMPEAEYYTSRSDRIDVTAPSGGVGNWSFEDEVPAPYGGADFNAMDAHGGLVMNALALANFGSEYLIRTGAPRSLSRGGAGSKTYFPGDGGISHTGLLFGTSALTWELSTGEPANTDNENGAGCLVPGDKQDSDDEEDGNGLNELDVEPCPIPQGIRVSVMFNGEPIAAGTDDFVRGRHDWTLLFHRLRRAASDVGTDADAWFKVPALSEADRRIGCDVECGEYGCWPWTCGNGVLDDGEECDDGDHEPNDVCNPDCTNPITEPAGYAACAGEDPGNCLGGPCAPREDKFVSDTDRLDPYSPAHPDGDWSRHTFCHDSHTVLSPPWDEATCVTETVLGKNFGVCRECGVDTMIGCACPAPNAEEGGCNIDGVSEGLSCIGGRCWDTLPPEWMCTADCDGDIYGTGGHCDHDDPKGAVCASLFCDEPVPGYCGIELGQVCNVNANGCANDSCCDPECLDESDCTDLGYSPGHLCVDERCVLQ